MKTFLRLVLWVILCGCAGRIAPPSAAEIEVKEWLERSRQRPTADRLRTRFHIKLKSKTMDLAASTNGGLVMDRTGRVRLDIFGPVGGVLVGLVSDGLGLFLRVTKTRVVYEAESAEGVLRDLTGGLIGLAELSALFVGDLPFDGAREVSVERSDVGVVVEFVLSGESRVRALLDLETTLPMEWVALNGRNEPLLSARYGSWKEIDGVQIPGDVSLYLPPFDLSADLKYRNPTMPAQLPDVFDRTPPEGFEQRAMEDVTQSILERGRRSPSAQQEGD